MFARKLEDFAGTDKQMVRTDGQTRLQSTRLLTQSDGCGFSVSDVQVSAGSTAELWYKNHVEGNLIISGEMELTDLTSGQSWELGAGDLYVVGPRDRHRITARTDLHAVSVFNPATIGGERHDADGSYPPTGDIPPAWQGESGRTMFVKRLSDTRVVPIGHGPPTPTATSSTTTNVASPSPPPGPREARASFSGTRSTSRPTTSWMARALSKT